MPQPEKMSDFFDARSEGYDAHMQGAMDAFEDFYAAIAGTIPRTEAALRILDVGCGTGLELDPILQRAPNAQITGVDLSDRMLARLRAKYADRWGQMTLIQGSYLALPLGAARYDWAVSAMTLHHLLPESKGRLYARIRRALKPGGRYVEGDYVVSPEKAARLLTAYREKMVAMKDPEEGAYHVDIPLSLDTQRALLLAAGFAEVEVVWEEGEAAVYMAGG
jgi:tRNA (cmo5U34)-methyltransferase